MAFDMICYLNFGYPTIADGVHFADLYVKAGCHSIQIDLPSRDPYLENAMIKERMAYCLAHEPDYEAYFEGIRQVRRAHPDIQLVFMVYENIIEELGPQKIIDFCKEMDMEQITYVGLDRPAIKKAIIDAGIGIACYVQFQLLDEEVESARRSNGIVLLQARPAGKVRPGYESFGDCVRYLREKGIHQPIYASVGIQSPEDVRTVKEGGADGVFVGSRIIKVQEDEALLTETIAEFRAATR